MDSIAFSENYNDADFDLTTSLQTPQAELSLADHSADDANDLANIDGSSLTVPHEEDKFSHGSRSSTAFATPKTGLTPTSSENDEDMKEGKRWSGVSTEGSEGASGDSTLNPSGLTDKKGRAREQSPEEHNAIVQQSSEAEMESSSPTSVSTPALDRLHLPLPDKHFEKSDDLSCTSTLTGSQGSLLFNDNGPKTNSQQEQQSAMNSISINFLSKTSTASPRMTKAEAKFSGKGDRKQQYLARTAHANIAINNADDEGHPHSEGWTVEPVVNSAALSREHSPLALPSASKNQEHPHQSTSKTDRTEPYMIAGTNSELEEESHSAGSGSFSKMHLDWLMTDPTHSPSYNHKHMVFDAHRISPGYLRQPPTGDEMDSSLHYRPHHSSSTGATANCEQPITATGTLSSRSNGTVPRLVETERKSHKSFLPGSLSIDHEHSSPEQYYSPMGGKYCVCIDLHVVHVHVQCTVL